MLALYVIVFISVSGIIECVAGVDTTTCIAGKWISRSKPTELCINLKGKNFSDSLTIKYYVKEIGDTIPIHVFGLPEINNLKNQYWTDHELLNESGCSKEQVGASCRLHYFTSDMFNHLNIIVGENFLNFAKKQIVEHFKKTGQYSNKELNDAAEETVELLQKKEMSYIWISTHPEVFLLYVWVPKFNKFCPLRQ
jgi:hypothetical protein